MFVRYHSCKTLPNKSLLPQREIEWLQHRLTEISFYKNDHAQNDSYKNRIIRGRIQQLRAKFAVADKNINQCYRNEKEWQQLHGIKPDEASNDKVWDNLDLIQRQQQMDEPTKARFNVLRRIRDDFIFEEMVSLLEAELGYLNAKKESSRYDSYKNMLQYTLNEIYQNKPSIYDGQPRSLSLLSYPFHPFPSDKPRFRRGHVIGQQGLCLFSLHRAKGFLPVKQVSEKEEDRHHFPYG